MENPFESGHIKNYILAYVSVVVIMVLFFIASTLFNDISKVQTKVFDTNQSTQMKSKKKVNVTQEQNSTHSMKFQLLKSAY